MTEQRILSRRTPGRTGLRRIEVWIESLLFAGRWLMAPIYLGLLVILGAVAVKFVEELVVTVPLLLFMKEREFVMFVLGLIDLALIGNLALMVAFVGYENFVSKLQTGDSEDRPAWMEHVDFSGLKLKLLSSIVAISAIHLLRTFFDISEPPERGRGVAARHSSRLCGVGAVACLHGSSERVSGVQARNPVRGEPALVISAGARACQRNCGRQMTPPERAKNKEPTPSISRETSLRILVVLFAILLIASIAYEVLYETSL